MRLYFLSCLPTLLIGAKLRQYLIESRDPLESMFHTASKTQTAAIANLWKKRGWLFDLLQREGIIDGSKQSRKESCWSY
jgi:hypothetical protein